MAELRPIIVFHGRHFVRHLGICNPICVKLLQTMSGVIPRNLKKRRLYLKPFSWRPQTQHTHRHTDTYTHVDSNRRNAMRCISPKNEGLVRQKLFKIHPEKPTWRFDIGQRVRISKRKQAFEKGNLPGWSEEIFVISKKFPTTPVTYANKNMSDEEIKCRFYEPELQLIIKEDNVYDVEKVIKTRRRNGKIEYYVKWKGYPDKFNSWIYSCSLVLANVGSSVGLNSRNKR